MTESQGFLQRNRVSIELARQGPVPSDHSGIQDQWGDFSMQGLIVEQFIYHLKDRNFSILSEAMLEWNDSGSLKYEIFSLVRK